MVYFQSLEVQDFVAEAGKKGCVEAVRQKEDEAHFYIHFDIEISPSSFLSLKTRPSFFLKNRVPQIYDIKSCDVKKKKEIWPCNMDSFFS